jgi:1-hydroxycarotenoid 3,4-desaturase
VVNADPAAVASGAFGARTSRQMMAGLNMERSLSAVTWAAEATTSGFPLARHNVFFSGDYAAEFKDLFGEGRLPGVPTVYVCAQDRADDVPPPIGPERLLILVNSPANGDRCALSEREVAICESKVFGQLAKCGLMVSAMDKVITTPREFNAMFPGTGGALYGPATHGWAAAFRRSGSRTRTPGLYLAGGGTHPGAGAPMAALSGRLAAEQIRRDQASMRGSRRGAISGGISTPSARMSVTA